jgi:hypothetical protein
MNDYHVMLMGSRAAGGFPLVFPSGSPSRLTDAPAHPAPASGTTVALHEK